MSASDRFDVFGLQPADAGSVTAAAAAASAAGVGLLDLEFYRDAERVAANFRRLLDTTQGHVGLRITARSAGLAKSLLALAGERPLTLIFAGSPSDQAQAHAKLKPAAHHAVLAELTDSAMPSALKYAHAGYVAKGHEAGGWVGADTSYILAQKLLGKLDKPVYVQGGVGVNTAAGLRALGAAGVVLDDQLLLLSESPLPIAQQNEIARLNGAETRLYGELVDAPCRVYSRPGNPALKAADEDGRAVETGTLPMAEWRDKLEALVSWNGGETLMPLGQGIGVAARYRDRYRTVGRVIAAIRKASLKNIETAAKLDFLAPGAPLAKSHGTQFPLCQGPMTRVSDSPAFAYEVSKSGALPFLALALMRGPQVLEMLQQTKALMTQNGSELPWGVGMLGFVPHSLREEQIAAVWQCKPTFALIAGGRPDQAAHFEKEGIPTYIHAPAPALLKMYIEQGAKRFVFEGRECGGHIGPLASFPLWEQMIETLLDNVPAGGESDYHVLFAGGIHDARSGAMLGALTAPLAARGLKVGALMGTAYLFTKEIVDSGAIVDGFQQQALACDHTVNLETGPGHSTRCADTPFARDFYETRRTLLRDGRSADEVRDTLEDLNMGRLRVASKGVNRDESGQIVDIAPDKQLADGMYMIGQVATLRDRVQTCTELHTDVCEGGSLLLQGLLGAREERAVAAKPADIAVVGIGTLLPKADEALKYWENIIDQVCVLGEVPKTRWDWELYFNGDRRARDKVYSRWGGFLDEIPFDPISYGIPPKSMKSIDPMQLLTLEVARRGLNDAGYADGDFDRENTSVILGAGGGLGDLGTQYAVRAELPRFVENLSDDVWERLPEWTEESFAGTLLNVAAGRVANRMDFGGLNFTIDAACGSSLAAITMAVNELEAGRSNLVIAGGIDTVQSPFGFMCFSKTQALSPTGKPKTFDTGADGIAISEGLAVVVLKRLADAERDGDRIYAVIKAAAGSSDGKALGMTAPRPEGQMRALKRAYAKAGFSPATLGMAEAHGTGTAVGDKAEAKTITTVLAAEGAAPRSTAIGSVKTLLGHTKASAGVAGMIKVALSLYYRTLPGHYGVTQPIEPIADPNSPVYLLKDARPWFASPDHPRRGGSSAFGFGGTNFHVVLEEYRSGPLVAPGAERWPHELFVLRAADDAALVTEVGRLATALRQGTRLKLRDIAYSLARQAESRPTAKATLAIVAKDYAGLIADLEGALAHLQNGRPLPPSARLGRGTVVDASQIALLFPGQGSQYVNMGRDAALYVEELRSSLELADATLREEFPRGLTRLMMPPAAFDAETETAQNKALTDTRVAQPAIGALALGYLRFVERLGLSASAAAGHSYGEYAALCAAGVLTPRDFLKLSAVRGSCMAEAARSSEAGAMAAIQARREVVEQTLGELGEAARGVRVANHNAPEQAVISGPAAGVEAAAKKLEGMGLRVTRLAVSGAFHTELVGAAQAGLSKAIHAADFGTAALQVYSNTTGKPYPAKAAAMRKQLDGHLLNSVEFVAELEAMYAAGARVFVELGPKGVCANMAKATLAGRDAVAVSLDGQGGGLRGLLLGLAELTAAGVGLQLTRLFDGRDAQLIELSRLADLVKPLPLPKHTWWLSGGCARPLDDPQMRTGALPPLNAKTSAAARERVEQTIMAKAPPKYVTAPGAAAQAAPVAAPAAMPTAAAPAMAGDALLAYQQTMRQFLSLQERVIQQFLGGAQAQMPAAPAMPMPAAPALAPVATPVAMPAAPAMPVAAAPVAAPAPVPATPPAAAAVAAPVAAVAAAPAISRESLQNQLLAIVADRTGYPSDMLGLDQDLEAELGIDSIKRVEILGALQKSLPGDASAAMQGGMEKFTRARSLTAILDAAMTLVPATAVAATAVPAVALAAATPAAPAVSRDSLQAQLLAIVADRTGYPSDMLGLDQDLEAELGIDSIKRVEILGALQKSLPGDASAAMQGGMEKFTRARSLNAILDAAVSIVPAQPAAATTAVAVAAVATAPATPAISRDGLQNQLLAIVADRTGYPSDMLGLDQDLEAELGIDSIKRVEILGELQKSLPGDASAAMQGGMEKFTRARSLNAILDAAMALAPAAPAAVLAANPVIAVAAAVPAATPAIDRATLQSQLLSIVADRTGYPSDMLGLDQDLEAELGIDSIKRVEILGELQKSLPGDASAAMQGGMEKFTRARSLNAILDAAVALAPAAAAPVAAVVAAAAPVAVAPAAPTLDRSSLQNQLLSIVADRTGYPSDMLGLDQDLEAELGIDSIKRVEILGELQKSLPGDASAAMQGGMEKFTRARSLNAILDAAMALAATTVTAAAAAPVSAAPAVLPTPVAAVRRVPRYVPRSRPAPLPAKRHKLEGLHLITGSEDAELAEKLAARIRDAGASAVIVDAASLTDPVAILSTLNTLRGSHGAVRGIVHLAGLAHPPVAGLSDWLGAAQHQVKALFFLMQQAGADLSAKDSVVLAASRHGGTLCRDAEGPSLAVAGGAVGLFNCAVAEWPRLRARLVDFEANADGDTIVAALFDELSVADGRTEVGYTSVNGSQVRQGFVHEAETLSDHPFAPHLEPAGDWVMLITGGARGITAEIAEELVKPGMRLVLVGRTPMPGNEDPALAGLSDAALKKALLQQAMAAGRKPKPAELDREYKGIMADREIRANLQRLTTAGALVDYRACDVRDPEAFGALIDAVYAEYGRIDAVLHGAGVIEDKRIADKTVESFDRVYDTKVASAWLLAQKLKHDSLKLIAFFTSVAGRFGNVGQGDYGAANETLNRYAWKLHRAWPRVRVVAINWGPWESGMATEAIQAGFRAQGIEPIPLLGGRRFFREELAFGAPKDVELIAGEGPWKYQAAQAPAPAPSEPSAAAPSAGSSWPLIRVALGMGAGGAVTLKQPLSLAGDPYLADHRMDGKAVLPAAGALEYIAQFVAAGYPEWQVAEVRDLRALSGIVLDGDKERELLLRARSSTHSEAGRQAVTVEIMDPIRKAANYRATVILAEQLPPATLAVPAPLSGERVDAKSAYASYLFHGQRFQLVTDITAVSAAGLDALVNPSSPQSFLGAAASGSRWLFDPGLVDTAPQLAIVWARINRGMTPLPSRFGTVARYGAEPLSGPLRLALRVKPAPHDHALIYDVHVVDSAGRVRLAISDAEGTMSEALNRLVGNS